MNKQLLNKIIDKKILPLSKEYDEIHAMKKNNEQLVMELNSCYRNSKEVNQLVGQIIDQSIEDTVKISLPFYTDFGKHIELGKNIFINQNVTFVDLGGITIEDDVLIGPMSRLVTVNHLIKPSERRGLQVKPIHIKKNAWLGANVTILPGVTVGENSIVSADSTVTKNVPDNVIVAGTPAKILKVIKEE
ncbi:MULTISPECIES: DapH/DapD/GlmU-related protein [Vagococcus]|uniref:Maltose O-acetyltransferase n=1 Tax=Vagococcus fluvialis bH819 TaxID=1255619 RepID=A0A1X6WPC7_9ENTE|nr:MULTISPECIES: DapH/DapD/GlmU-related protein [Vagococcus]SLM86145.1 Maltose O-acetyltransferase [Vagococcus fluvialis bH819]HCM90393.1 acetyltransferase [Vagococcus sp.]